MADEVKSADIILEGNTATWEMKIDGNIQGTYMGKFRFRCYLTPAQTIAANREFRELLGPNPAFTPEHESNLAFCLTQLKYRIIESPPFWGSTESIPGNIPDENVISAIMDAAALAEQKYREQLAQRKADALKRAIAAAERTIKKNQEEEEPPSEDKS